MDFFVLYLTGRILNRPAVKIRLIMAASAGGILASVLTLRGCTDGAVTVLAGIAVSCAMTRIAFGRCGSIVSLLRDSAVVWGCGILLGGIMTFVLQLGEPVYFDYGNDFSLVFIISTGLALVVARLFSSGNAKKSVDIHIETMGMSVSLKGLCDSGNMAREPFSSLPVIIVSSSALGDIGTLLEHDDTPLKLRLIPIDGIGGHTVMRGFVPDVVTANGKTVAAVVASDPVRRSYSGYDAIVPSVLAGKIFCDS